MQYNLVATTNSAAIRLWLRHGFTIVGTLPQAFAHPTAGLVDAHVMHKAPMRHDGPPPPRPVPGKVDLAEAFGRFDELWSPRIVGELNGQQVKVAKLGGKFVWHKHDDEDELFLVVRGQLHIHLRDPTTTEVRIIELTEGQFLIVPRGVEHQPVAEGGAHVVLFEPAATLNTGDHAPHEFTVDQPAWLSQD